MSAMADIEGYCVLVEDGSGSRESSFEELFDLFYDPLARYMESDAGDAVGVNAICRDRYEDPAYAFEQRWDARLSTIDATLELDHGHKTVTYDLEPITDIDPDRSQVVPSAITASYGDEPMYVVREWRRYDEDILTDMHNHGRGFKRNSHDDYLYRSILRGSADREQFDGSIVMVPELDLELALHAEEGIYETMPEDAQPITPYNVRVAEFTDDSAFVLREYLPNELEDRTDGFPERFGRLYGTMQELGVVSCFDRKDEFAREESRFGEYTVFHDPEFVAYTDNENWFAMDWRDLREGLFSDMPERTIERIKEEGKRADPGLDVDLLDSIYGQPEPEMFPSWKLL